MKKAVITILGTAGTRFDKEEQRYVIKNKALYQIDTDLSIKGGEFYNTLPILIKNYTKDNYDIVTLYTKEAKQAQEEVLKAEELEYVFDSNFLIENFNDNKDIFSIINNALSDYDEVIFDVSHGFRHLPILATIGMIVENIKAHNKIKQILFAQELVPFKEYKIVDLKEYLDIANIAFAIQTFLNMYKVPELALNHPLYNDLKNFSTHLTTNQYHDMFQNSLPTLLTTITDNKKAFYFINKQLDELEELLKKIKSIQAKQTYEKFLFFAELFLDKDYFLLSSTYMIESISLYIGEIFKRLELMNFQEQYEYQSKIVNFLRNSIDNKYFNIPHRYFYDINSAIFSKFYIIRDKIADIRHNLVHINPNKSFTQIEEELKENLKNLQRLIDAKELENLDFTLINKTNTITYKLEEIDKVVSNFYQKINIVNKPKLNTLWRRFKKNELDEIVPNNILLSKLNSFFEREKDNIEKLFKMKENKIYLLEKN